MNIFVFSDNEIASGIIRVWISNQTSKVVAWFPVGFSQTFSWFPRTKFRKVQPKLCCEHKIALTQVNDIFLCANNQFKLCATLMDLNRIHSSSSWDVATIFSKLVQSDSSFFSFAIVLSRISTIAFSLSVTQHSDGQVLANQFKRLHKCYCVMFTWFFACNWSLLVKKFLLKFAATVAAVDKKDLFVIKHKTFLTSCVQTEESFSWFN